MMSPSVDMSLPSKLTGAAGQLAVRHADDHDMKLYGSWFCPYVQRVWITLCEKQIAHQYVEINPYCKDPAFLQMNPRGLVPTLAMPAAVDSGEHKRRVLYESTVVCEYLDEAFADVARHGPSLLPTNSYNKARARLWIDHVANRIVPAFYKLLQHTADKAYSLDDARQALHGHIRTLVEQMNATGPWFLGGDISLVDIALAPWAQRLSIIDHYKLGGTGIPREGGDDLWTRWASWMAAVQSRQSIRDTSSEKNSYILAYKRYAEDTTNSMVGKATRLGQKLP